MPTNTFFRLPREKQDLICTAAMKEFIRVPYEEASINQIILKAGIPRGSFYMYFQDKEDLYLYLIETHHSNMEHKFEQILEENHGDFILAYLSLFQEVMDKIELKKQNEFFRRTITNSNFKNDPLFCKREQALIFSESIFQKICKEQLVIKTEEELLDIIDLIHMLFIRSLIKIVKGQKQDEVYNTFKRQLFILKDGLYKKEEKNYV